jgi:rhodanese-related sulfurtransferase
MLAEITGGPVEHLAGGMIAWEAAGQPVDKP